MTEKLYYNDAYIRSFSARVEEIIPQPDGYLVRLDRTAFFPEEGGQSADGGVIGGIKVLDVKERDGEIYHLMSEAPVSADVECSIDFDKRFEKMQCHTAEHILCGIIHRLWGYENVGFHLGDEIVTFDVDGELTREQLDEVERLANRAVFDNHKVSTFFPTPEELEELTYRAKLDIKEGVRIVRIGDIDSCACCAPHVSRTGEIGMIKLVDFMRHRGGMRISMVAGHRALADYSKRYEITRQIGALTSTPSLGIWESVRHMNDELERVRKELDHARICSAIREADMLDSVRGNYVALLEGATMDALREFSNRAREKVSGILVALTGTDGDYKYIISSNSVNLRDKSKQINIDLCGRGGGRPEMIQGSFAAALDDIKEYFK